MDPLLMATILLLAGLLVLVAEAVLPSHGVLGTIAGILLVAAVYFCFVAGPWVGIGALAVMVLVSPFVFMGLMAIWPKTPVGRRLVLNATVPPATPMRQIPVGAQGVTVTELRPIGECDFGELRTEVISEYGVIRAGETVKVVAIDADGRAVVKHLPQGGASEA